MVATSACLLARTRQVRDSHQWKETWCETSLGALASGGVTTAGEVLQGLAMPVVRHLVLRCPKAVTRVHSFPETLLVMRHESAVLAAVNTH